MDQRETPDAELSFLSFFLSFFFLISFFLFLIIISFPSKKKKSSTPTADLIVVVVYVDCQRGKKNKKGKEGDGYLSPFFSLSLYFPAPSDLLIYIREDPYIAMFYISCVVECTNKCKGKKKMDGETCSA